MPRKTKKRQPGPTQPKDRVKPAEAPAKEGGENVPKEPATPPPDNKPRSTRAKLKGIIKQNLDAMTGKIADAPLNQLTTNAVFAFKQIERIDSVRAIADSEPLYYSRLSDELLKAFEYIISVLCGDTPIHPVPEIQFGCAESDSGSSGSLSDAVEPALPAAPLQSEEGRRQPPDLTGIPKMHRWLAEQLHNLHERRGSRIALIAPRGSAKTTWITLAYVLRCAVEGTERYILLLSDSEAQAEQFLSAIRSELEGEVVESPSESAELKGENEELEGESDELPTPDSTSARTEGNVTLALAYPEACGPGPEWRKDYLRLKNGVLIESLGRGSKIRGRKNRQHRPTLIVIDDCQSNRDILSASERQKALDWFTKEVLPCGTKTTNIISVGSALHQDAVAVHAMKTPGWISNTFQAIESMPKRIDLWAQWERLATNLGDDNRTKTAADFYENNKEEMERGGVSYWPAHMPLSYLMLKRAEIGDRQFDTEYQGVPSSP